MIDSATENGDRQNGDHIKEFLCPHFDVAGAVREDEANDRCDRSRAEAGYQRVDEGVAVLFKLERPDIAAERICPSGVGKTLNQNLDQREHIEQQQRRDDQDRNTR